MERTLYGIGEKCSNQGMFPVNGNGRMIRGGTSRKNRKTRKSCKTRKSRKTHKSRKSRKSRR